MAAKQFLGTRYQSLKDDGTVNAGGSVYFFETGTSTAKTTYSDSALSVANAHPVVLNSAGAADIWYNGDADVTVKDSAGTTIDNYPSINPTTSTSITESNFIANGSFEEGGSTTPTGWVRSTPPSGGTSAQDTDSAHGLYSWKFTSGGSGAGSLISDSFFNVAVGRTFNVIWQMKSSIADVRNLVEVVWYDDADAELSASSLYDASATNPTSWTTKGALATPVTSAVRAKLRLTGCHSSDATPGSTWFDGVFVGEAPINSTALITTIELGHATDTTISRSSAGNITIEGNLVYRAGGTDVPVADGGTGASTAAAARTNLELYSGTYTPTLYNTTNVASSTAGLCSYIRIGTVVHVSGSVSVTPTASAGALTELGISLPYSTTTGASGESSWGTANAYSESLPGTLRENSGLTDRTNLYFDATSTSAWEWFFTFSYIIV